MQQITFDRRKAGDGPVRVQMIKLGGTFSESPPTLGTGVYLRSEDVHVGARIIAIEDEVYIGEITGFEDWEGEFFKGLRAGDKVRFIEENIFSYSL